MTKKKMEKKDETTIGTDEKVSPCNRKEKHQELKIGDILIREMPVDGLEIAETNVRIIGREELLGELSKNIKERGLIHLPLATSDGKIYVGGRRLLAYKKAGKTVIPVRVFDAPERDQILLSLSDNLYSEPPCRQDFTEKIVALKEKYGMTLTQIAKEVGLHKSTLCRYTISVPKGIEEEKREAFRKEVGEVGVRKADCIRRFLTTSLIKERQDLRKQMIPYLKQLSDDYLESFIQQANLDLPVLEEMKHIAQHKEKYRKLVLPISKDIYTNIRKYTTVRRMSFLKLLAEALFHYMEKFPADMGSLRFEYKKTKQDE